MQNKTNNLSIRPKLIKIIFDYDYKKESNSCKYLKIILNNGLTYNSLNIEVFTNNIQIENDISINYLDIKQILIY